MARYGLGDATGNGIGSTWNSSKSDIISYRVGVWDEKENSKKSSKFEELTNLVKMLDEIYKNGELNGI